MKKCFLCLLGMTLCLWTLAVAEPVSLRTWTPFAEVDPGAQGWETLLRGWSEETGAIPEDYSGSQDEAWFAQLREAMAAGRADVVVLPMGAGMGADLLPASEIAAQLSREASPIFTEADGSVSLLPVRLGCETLFVNEDVFAAMGLAVPTSWEELVVDCMLLSNAGVLPIANSLTEWPEILLDCAALIASPAEAYGGEETRRATSDVLGALLAVGAFGKDPWNLGDAQAAEAFLAGRAAMRFDAWEISQSVPEERADAVRAIALFGMDASPRTALPGYAGLGVGVSRRCMEDPARRDAALALVGKMVGEEGWRLCSASGGALARSMAELTRGTDRVVGVLYDYDPEHFDEWAEGMIAAQMDAQAPSATP